MTKSQKMKGMLIGGTVVVSSLLLLFVGINNRESIDKIGQAKYLKEEPEELFSYVIYDNSNDDKNKVLINLNSEDGIEYIETPETKIYGNGKTKLSLDYVMGKNQNYVFKIKEVGKEEVQELVQLDESSVQDSTLTIELLSSNNGYEVINIKNSIGLSGYTAYYKIGEGENAVEEEGSGKIPFLDYDIVSEGLMNDDNTVTISARLQDKNGNSVRTQRKIPIDPNAEEARMEADSLIEAMQKYDFGTGRFKVNVADEEYSLKVISFENDLEIDGTSTIGSERDVANASENAKNMVVLKVGGNLTIKKDAILTTYTSRDGYGGPKGFLIYCDGTITNNGTIDNSHGAKAEGQEVYLWKNENGAYESIPKTGATGGGAVNGWGSTPGKNGNNGSVRKTGGGGSGGCVRAGMYGNEGNSKAGASGTSYSGGTGSGGVLGTTNNDTPSPIGGKGGNGLNGNPYSISGGAGNPSGTPAWYAPVSYKNGTGGLLIIYANNISNNGKITALGTDAGNAGVAGGSSGGGSINIFYKETYSSTSTSSISAAGGKKVGTSVNGGAGGTGSIAIGQIVNGTYQDTYHNW